MSSHHLSCLHFDSRGSKHNISVPLWFCWVFFPSVYSVLPVTWPSGYLELLNFPFRLSSYLFDLSWAPPAQTLFGFAWHFHVAQC